MSAQNGHWKSAHSTMVTAASGGPCAGESSSTIVFTPFGSKRALKASARASFGRPRRTCLAMNCAAGRHVLHARFSRTHCAMLTGTSGQGASSSFTCTAHSAFSRAVSAEMSTPGSSALSSAEAPVFEVPAGSGFACSEPPHVPAANAYELPSAAKARGNDRESHMRGRSLVGLFACG